MVRRNRASGVDATSPTRLRPTPVSRSAVRLPTPHSAETGNGCRNASTSSRGTTSMPSGLHSPEASLATNLVDATPTEQVIPWAASTRARMSAPIRAGVTPNRRSAPDTSRNASSRLSGSTSGVMSRKIDMTPLEASWYSGNVGGRNTAFGHSRRACAVGMAERMPNVRAM
jgi:hypothetical protein